MAKNPPKIFSVLNPAGVIVFQGRVIAKDERAHNRSYAIEPAWISAIFREAAQTGLLVFCGNEEKFVYLLKLLAYAWQRDLQRKEAPAARPGLIKCNSRQPEMDAAPPLPFYVWGGAKRIITGVYCRTLQENRFWADAGTIKSIFQQAKPASTPVYLGNTEQLRGLMKILTRARDYPEASLFERKQKVKYGGGVELIWEKVFTIKRNG